MPAKRYLIAVTEAERVELLAGLLALHSSEDTDDKMGRAARSARTKLKNAQTSSSDDFAEYDFAADSMLRDGELVAYHAGKRAAYNGAIRFRNAVRAALGLSSSTSKP